MTAHVAPIVTGQDLNAAARATRSVLDQLLERAGTSFPVYVTLNTVHADGGGASPSRLSLRHTLMTGLQMDATAAEGILDRMTAGGLLRWSATAPHAGGPDDPPAELTPEGRALQQRIAADVAEATARLWRGFAPEDLETTKRVLLEVTTRARAEVAG